MFLGDDLLAWLVLALGGALLVGNVMAIVRPPAEPKEDNALERAPIARSAADGGDRPGGNGVGPRLARGRLNLASQPHTARRCGVDMV